MNKKIIFAAALTGLVAASGVGLTVAQADNHEVKCAGANSCKGSGACGGADHKCAGKNACKGKGWTKEKSEKDCTDKGGKVVK